MISTDAPVAHTSSPGPGEETVIHDPPPIRHALVVGSGITGLATALALSSRGIRVTVVEQDPPPEVDASDASGAFLTWRRAGVPQIRHSHAFLGRLRRLLRERHPEVLRALLEAGAREYRMVDQPPPTLDGLLHPEPGDEELVTLGCRRTTFEWVLRRTVSARPGVEILSRTRVAGLVATRDDPPRVVGLRHAGGEIRGDLVVDTSGRRSPCREWLEAIGARPPVEETESSGILYYTRFYRLRPGATEPPRSRHPAAGDWNWIKWAVFPADDRTFSITLASPLAVPRMKVLARPAAFDEMVRAIPGIAPWLDPAISEPIEDLDRPVQAMGGLINRLRRFVDDQGPLVHGFFVLGDAAYCTNPLYGRGCAQGFLHAEILGQAIADRGHDLDAVARAVDQAARDQIEPFYRASVQADRDHVRRAEGREPGTLAGRFTRRFFEEGVVPATRCDPVVFRAFLRMMNMLETPEQAFGRPEVIVRSLWVMLRPSFLGRPYQLDPPPDREATMERLEAAA